MSSVVMPFLWYRVRRECNDFLNMSLIFVPTFQIGFCVWPVIQTVNFWVIPLKHRVSFVGFFSYIWNTFLSYMHHYKVEGSESSSFGETQQMRFYLKFVVMKNNTFNYVLLLNFSQAEVKRKCKRSSLTELRLIAKRLAESQNLLF